MRSLFMHRGGHALGTVRKSWDSLTWTHLTYLDICNNLLSVDQLIVVKVCSSLTEESFTTDDQQDIAAIFSTLITD